MAKGDMFLKIDDIKGESGDDAHKGEIDIRSWSWGVAQASSAQMASGPGAGKAQFGDLNLTKYPDRATAVFIKMCAAGTPIKKAQLTVRKAGGKPLEFIKISMENAIITNVSLAGAGGDAESITENVTVSFGSVKVEYTPQQPDGSGGAAVTMGWDIVKNKRA